MANSFFYFSIIWRGFHSKRLLNPSSIIKAVCLLKFSFHFHQKVFQNPVFGFMWKTLQSWLIDSTFLVPWHKLISPFWSSSIFTRKLLKFLVRVRVELAKFFFFFPSVFISWNFEMMRKWMVDNDPSEVGPWKVIDVMKDKNIWLELNNVFFGLLRKWILLWYDS